MEKSKYSIDSIFENPSIYAYCNENAKNMRKVYNFLSKCHDFRGMRKSLCSDTREYAFGNSSDFYILSIGNEATLDVAKNLLAELRKAQHGNKD